MSVKKGGCLRRPPFLFPRAGLRTWLEPSCQPRTLAFLSSDPFVPPLSRPAVFLLGALCPLLALGAAQPAASAPAAEELPADLAKLLAPPSLWGSSTRMETMAGYKDNLLLSSAGEERSAFLRASAQIVVLRLPERAFDYSLLAEVAATRYLGGRRYADGTSTTRDLRAYFFNEIGWKPSTPLRLSLPLTGYYNDEVIDQSDTDIVRTISAIRVGGANLGPTARWTFHPAWWIETQVSGERKRYKGGANDSDIGEGALRLGWKPNQRLKIGLGAEERWRSHERRAQFSAAGRELAGTALKVTEREVGARVGFTWDRAGRWRTATKADMRSYRDNGSGYFNFREKGASHEVEWEREPWLVRLGGAARRVDFDVQTVGFGVAPPPRIRDEFNAELRVERQVAKRWTVFLRYEWERSRSNDPLSSYIVNEGLLGVRWNWDK